MEKRITFTPALIGRLEIKNRFVKASTAESLALDTGAVSDDLIRFYERYAQFDLGLIFTGHMSVHPSGKAHARQTAIWGDEFIPGLKGISEAVHRHGGHVFAQINHAGSQVRGDAAEPLGPSPVKNPLTEAVPRELRSEEIEAIIAAFGSAARRVKEAGFDGVHIHAGHGYLISEFNSPYGNRREDAWGGTPEKRSRFLRRVVEEVKNRVGPDYLVSVKLGIADAIGDGLKKEEGAGLARALAELGIDAIELSCGVMEPTGGSARPVERLEDEAYFLPYAAAVREAVGDLPIILVGGLKTPALMEKVIRGRSADFVSLGRSLIREPDFVSQIGRGRLEAATCTSCNQCIGALGQRGLRCYVDEPLTEEEKAP
jgi:2,4-dienoyl-CoA reductase-like NADH-dependent reductase (Old Yellow Enzyme family)